MSGKSHASRITPAVEQLGNRRPAEEAGARTAGGAGARAQPRAGRARHAFADLGVEAGSRLVFGKPDDAYEVEAERAADRALANGPFDAAHSSARSIGRSAAPRLSTARPGFVQARARTNAGATAPPQLAQAVANAAVEGRPLPPTQRTFFEQGLGHDFSAVRIHAGPAAAAAADSAGAQAFAHEQNIYFGADQYRPDSGPGQWLLAHELAHTVQQRPNVIARRVLPMGGDDPMTAAAADEAQADPRVHDAVDALTDAAGDGPASGGQIAGDQLRDLDAPSRLAALARLQSRIPPGKQQEVAGRLDEALGEGAGTSEPDRQGDAKGPGRPTSGAGAAGVPEHDDAARQRRKDGERKRGAELRSSPTTAPAPIQNVAEEAQGASAPAPSHARASAAAATQIQQAAQPLSEETSPQGETDLAASQEAAGAGPAGKPEKPAAATGAQAAASETTALMAAQFAQLANMRSFQPRFQMDAGGLSRDPREALRRQDSDQLAVAFVDGAAKQVEAVIAAATKFPAQALASLADARSAVAAATASQIAAVRDGAAAARKKVSAQSARAQAIIEGARAHADGATDAAAKSARDRAKTAYDKARNDVNDKANDQRKAIDKDFADAAKPMAAVGFQAGHAAWPAMAARRAEFLSEKNGESTILDGAYHDNQCDARAEAAEQVHEEYRKSFIDSANKQAEKLPENKPEVVGKVAEVAKKLDDGLGEQFKQINDSVDAFEKGAKAQTLQTAAKIKSSVAASAAQSTAVIDQTAEEQTQQLAAQGEQQQNTLDQAAQSALAAVAGGVAQACGQMIQSIGVFVASAAAMPPPPREELAPALDQAAAQAAGGADAMRAQLETAGPTLAANLATGVQSASEGLAAMATAVCQGLDQIADSFVHSAAGMSQQAVSGFRSLTKANEKTAAGIAKTAEDGFAKAQKAAADSFHLFSETVQETFATGRRQLLDSLWSKENQKKFDEHITKYAKQAADQVQPRWKKVLKWVITIVIVIAAIAITIASAGSLGPVGIVLLGAALGAAAGAVQTIANNLIDGKKWSDGVAKAMIVGAISGAVGGAGGVVLKGVGSIGVKIALEAGINVIGGVAGEAVGSVAVGETINWQGAFVGALVGAGIGAGLGIAGALKGKIRFGSFGGEAPAAAPPRPTVEPPAPPAPGKLRSVLEQTKILAPRPGAPAPEINVGGTAAGEGAPPGPRVAEQPAPVAGGEPAAAAPELAPTAPRRATGLAEGEPIAATPEPATARTRPAGEPSVRPQSPREAMPRTAEPPSATTPAADVVPPRSVAEPPAPRPAAATEVPRALPEPTAPRPQPIKPAVPEPGAPRPRAGEPSLPDNVRPIESAVPGSAGDQPRLRTQRPSTTAEEFAARQRARAGGGSRGGGPPEVEPQVQRQPVAQAAGAEGYVPEQVQPRLQVIEGGAKPGAVGGRSPVEVQASAGPPGRGGGPAKPSAGRGEVPRPAPAEPGAGAGPSRARPTRGRPSVAKEPTPQRPSTEPVPTEKPAPSSPAKEPAAEPATNEPSADVGKGASGSRGSGRRVTHEKFGDGTVVGEGEGKTTVAFDDGSKKTIVSERLTPTDRPGPSKGPQITERPPAKEPRVTKAERRMQARSDAETARIRREIEGWEGPRQKPRTPGEALSGEEGFGPGTEEPGELGGAEVRRGPGGRETVSEDRAVAEAAGQAFERPIVRDFAASQPPTARTFGSALGEGGSWAQLREEYPSIARQFPSRRVAGLKSRPDAISVDPSNRKITLLDPTSSPNPRHQAETLEFMQRLLDDPKIQAEFNGWEVTAREQYWEQGFEAVSHTRRIGGPVTGGTAAP